MPKHNPKRDKKPAEQKDSQTKTPQKKAGYVRKAPTHVKFFGAIIILAFIIGLVYLLYQAPAPDTRPSVQQWDHVDLNLCIWLENTWIANNTAAPDSNTTGWYNFTTIYQNSTDTSIGVNTTGLPVGIYSGVNGGDGVLDHHVGDSSSTPLYILACSDLDKDGYDDYNPKQKALGWGFPDTNPFYNKTIIVTWAILNLTKVLQNTPNNKLGNNSTQSLQDGVPFRIVTREAYRAVLPDL